MKKSNILATLLLLLLVGTSTYLNAQCSPGQLNINDVSLSSGATSVIPDTNFTFTVPNMSTDFKTINSTFSAGEMRILTAADGRVMVNTKLAGSTVRNYFNEFSNNETATTYTGFLVNVGGKFYVNSNDGGTPTTGTGVIEYYRTSDVIGSGTDADPYRQRTKYFVNISSGSYDATRDIMVVQTISYSKSTNKRAYFRRDFDVIVPTSVTQSVKLYEWRDMYFQSRGDLGYGVYAEEGSANVQLGSGGVAVNPKIIGVTEGGSASVTPPSNSFFLGFLKDGGTPWKSWFTGEYSVPVATNTSSMVVGNSLNKIISGFDSDIGFSIEYNSPVAGATTTYSGYTIVSNRDQLCLPPPCNATTAPAVNTAVNNTCPASTVNLNTQAYTGSTPAGLELRWFTNNAHTGAHIANPTAVEAGDYYAFYYDATNTCYGPASSKVTVSINTCAGNGTINCAKTKIITAPVQGSAGQKVLELEVNVTATGQLPFTIDGSGTGFTLVNSPYQTPATSTGIQKFYIPVNYSGAALGNLTITLTGSSSTSTCTLDLTNAGNKRRAVIETWSQECIETCGPTLQ